MTHPIIKTNFFIFTGGPGAGKTSVLNELARLGYRVVPEAARLIIQEQIRLQSNATHNGDKEAFRDLMLQQSVIDFKNQISTEHPVFFDRGLPDLQGYSQGFCSNANPQIVTAIDWYRYNPIVFIFPPWQEIYRQDNERQQDMSEAIYTFNVIKDAYQSCGYTLIELPKTSVLTRVEFILNIINSIISH